MFVSQPEIPVPLAVEFPFPAWATRESEAVEPAAAPAGTAPGAAGTNGGRRRDPFAGLPGADDPPPF
jgi:hypothetical protein